jgi:hypothetical protein
MDKKSYLSSTINEYVPRIPRTVPQTDGQNLLQDPQLPDHEAHGGLHNEWHDLKYQINEFANWVWSLYTSIKSLMFCLVA